jgi:multidrug efflux pump subunit AcrA (membrane-fusion protein)
LTRLIRANAGRIALFSVWFGAALACGVWLVTRAPRGVSTAVATVRQFPVLPPVDGRLASVSVTPGQHVEAGQELAVIEVPGLDQQIAAASSAVQTLEAELVLEGVDLDRKFTRDAEAAQARMLSATVELQASRAELAAADTELARHSADGVAVSASVVASLRLQKEGLVQELRAREKEIVQLRSAYEGARGRKGPAMDALLAASLGTARAEHEALVALKEACVLRAPVSGIVGMPYMEMRAGSPVGHPTAVSPGQWAQAGVPILTLTETVGFEAISYVAPRIARTIEAGHEAYLVNEDGQTLVATVISVGGAVEPMPLRYITDPALPEWGVPVTVRTTDQPLTPGEELVVEFAGRPEKTPPETVAR